VVLPAAEFLSLMKILLLSPYDAASHRVWREGLVRSFPEHEWVILSLPPRFFAWRTRGNPLSLAFGNRETLTGKYDLLIATSMTDLAELKGIVPALAVVPSVVYFHENQFAYPEQRARKEYQNYKFTNLYTALAADAVLFNSRYNRDTFLEGADSLLQIMPDHVPRGIVRSVAEKSRILPVPLEEGLFKEKTVKPSGPITIVWNHRWEHDKAPDRFFEALFKVRERKISFLVHVIGQRFKKQSDIFTQAREKLGEQVLSWGYVEDRRRYKDLLASSDVVVSTALHDFQGLAVLEGVAAGCRPLVPDRLAYPEFIPPGFRYPSLREDPCEEAAVLADRIGKLCVDPEGTRSGPIPDLECLSWNNMASKYREIIEGTVVVAGA